MSSVISTMQEHPLTITDILRHGATVYADSVVTTWEGGSTRSATYAEVAARAGRLAGALSSLGIAQGDRVGTFMWNNQEHLEAYLAVPSMGAVLHTLNLRLFSEQLEYVINHAADRIIIVNASVLPLLAKVASGLTTVEQYVLVGGDADTSVLGDKPVHRYEDLLAQAADGYDWPQLDELAPAAMCYTSGTTGNPKGVVYSHRSNYLHSLAEAGANTFGLAERDRILSVVPMFHANAWGLPYGGWLAGCDFVMPDRHLQAEPLAQMIEQLRPTVAGAVPSIWNDLLAYVDEHPTDLSSLRVVPCGGSAVPLALMQAFQERHGVHIVQAWGMTETSPLAAVAHAPKGHEDDPWPWRAKTGRVAAGVRLRIVGDSGEELPWDGRSVGEIQVKGPWITGSYHLDPDPDKFQDGWLRTGDVASVLPNGFIQITDRSKDVIKSGGEWISSVDLENSLMGHPAVYEAAVVAVPDDRWDERPLACVVLRPGKTAAADELRDFLADKVAKWQLPERWAFIPEVPKTSVGKFDKKVLRRQYGEGELSVEQL